MGSALIVDYNEHGATLNRVVQERASDRASRRRVEAWRYGEDGELGLHFSPESCAAYDDITHEIEMTRRGRRVISIS